MACSVAMQYVKSLLDMRSNRPDPKDIGVITPYHKQVQKIRKVLAQYSQIKVSVRMILYSMVNSCWFSTRRSR